MSHRDHKRKTRTAKQIGLILCEGKAELYFFRFIVKTFSNELQKKGIELRFCPYGMTLNEEHMGIDKIASDLEKRVGNGEYSFIFAVYDAIDEGAKNVEKACKKHHAPKVIKLASDICIETTLYKLLKGSSVSIPALNKANQAKSAFQKDFCPNKKVTKKGAHHYDWLKSPIGKEELLKFDFLKSFFKTLNIQ